MCDCQRTSESAAGTAGERAATTVAPSRLSRRRVIAGAALLGLAACGPAGTERRPLRGAAAGAPVTVTPGLSIHPREEWASGRPPKAPIGPETVRFLLVHHTASSNVVADPRLVMQQTYDFHTSRAKGWPDVCYHFFVAPDGSVWEGRAGSLAGPVLADATGGNQGFAQLVCLIGDFSNQAPTPAAEESLMRTLLWLADRYDIDTEPAATVTFTSRGSDKFRAGTSVTTSTVSGHRDVTYTACPGNAGYAQLDVWRRRIHATRLMREDTGATRRAVRLGVHLT